MCLWLLTACLGMLPVNPSPNIIIQTGVPTPILTPTTTTAPPATTARPPASSVVPPPSIGTTSRSPSSAAPPPTMVTSAAPPPMTVITATPPPATTTAPPPMTVITATPPPVTTAAPPPATTTAPPPMTVITATPPPVTTAAPPPATTAAPPPATTAAPPPATTAAPPPSTTRGPMIDPRLGTTPGASAAYQGPPITGYTAPIPAFPTFDSAVKFPRERRSLDSKELLPGVKDFIMNIRSDESGHRIRKRQNQQCTCVLAGTCHTGNYGAGLIDFRIVNPGGGGTAQCPAGQVLCCTAAAPPTPTPTVACGTLQQVPAVAVTPGAGQANYGEYPWQALILTNQNDYIAGGVLIDQRNVITVTHRIASFIVSGTTPNVKVRLGEWDAAATYEPVPYKEYSVVRASSHPQYNALTLQYDITVLRLASEVPLTPAAGAVPTINRACLPPSAASSYVGQRCWVSGWGKNMFGVQGQYQAILKKVDVPIVAPATCQAQLQAARLGATYVLDTTSFICAGGESNKDACTGDGGSGLVCNVNGQWVIVGLVSWGLGCANPNVPAAYVNVAALLPWIQQTVATP